MKAERLRLAGGWTALAQRNEHLARPAPSRPSASWSTRPQGSTARFRVNLTKRSKAMRTSYVTLPATLGLVLLVGNLDGAMARARDCGGDFFRCTDACNKPGRGGDIRSCNGVCDVNLEICIRCAKGQGSPGLCQGQPGQPGEKSEDSGTHTSDQPPRTGTGTYQPPAPQSPGTYQPPAGGGKSQH
jgi:hypothetical protein